MAIDVSGSPHITDFLLLTLSSTSVVHDTLDGRTAFMILNLLCEYVSDAIEGKSPSLDDLKWGEEVARLSVACPFIWEYAKSGKAPELPTLESCLPPPALSSVPAKVRTSTLSADWRSYVEFFSFLGSSIL